MDSTMPDRGLPLSLWGIWWNATLLLRPAFSRLRTFMWFATAVAGLTVRLELLGVTSIVRALNLRPRLYTKLQRDAGALHGGEALDVHVGAHSHHQHQRDRDVDQAMAIRNSSLGFSGMRSSRATPPIGS